MSDNARELLAEIDVHLSGDVFNVSKRTRSLLLAIRPLVEIAMWREIGQKMCEDATNEPAP